MMAKWSLRELGRLLPSVACFCLVASVLTNIYLLLRQRTSTTSETLQESALVDASVFQSSLVDSDSDATMGSNWSVLLPRPAAEDTSEPPLICDPECQRFRRLLDEWPSDKPKAAVLILIQRRSVPIFAHSVQMFDANFNDVYRYPLIVFYESNMDNEDDRRHLRSLTNSSLFFQLVQFDMPPFINRSAVPSRLCFKGIGYRHMCRFQAKTVYDQPILVGLRYVLRLDDDSFVTRAVGYDVFRYMSEHQIQYGFVTVVSDYGPCIIGLWPAVSQYIRQKSLKTKFRWPRGRIFWNNFELSELSVWRSTEYRDYVDYIDRLGGIYYHRWGDATIKTIAVTLFVDKQRTHHFKDIAYKHGKHAKL